MRSFTKLTVPVALAILAGCATHYPTVTSQGALPQGGTYSVLSQDVPGPVEDLVSRQLATLGFERSDRPEYLVQIGTSRRAAKVGALVPDPAEQQWLRRPWPSSRRSVGGVTVTLSERETGREIYRATAAVRSGGDNVQDHLEPLIATMLMPPARGNPPPAR